MSHSPSGALPVRGALPGLIRRLHFYIGLFIAPFIFIAALSGTLYVLAPQLENYLYREALTTSASGEARPLSQQISAAREYAGQQLKIYAVRPAPQAGDTTRVQFADPSLGASESRSVFIDPYTLAVKGDMTVYGTSGILPLRTWLDNLHRGLLLGDIGRNYSELAASWLWVAALGGVVLWAMSRPRRRVKAARGAYATARRWHITLGLVLVVGLLFFSVTGLTWSRWAGGNIDAMRTSLNWLTPQVNTELNRISPPPAADPHAEHHAGMDMSMMGMMPAGHSVNPSDGDWDRVLNAARLSGIDAEKVELRQPKGEGRAWTVTEIDRSWPTQVDAVSVNPQTFAIVDSVRFATFPLVAKLTRWGVDAHMGILFGLANQLVLALFGFGLCAMIVLGYRQWWLRRPAVSAIHPLATISGCWLALDGMQRVLVVVVTLLLGFGLPLMGISLLLLIALDIWRWRQTRSHLNRQQVEAT
ncbi:membrane protein [Salmonella enterica subsp. enterica serovar Choleraesuis]|nr:membrane protein [Salmonella enterica subsp. enterica serovar Choleraesuis]